jgi:hypothetical protein
MSTATTPTPGQPQVEYKLTRLYNLYYKIGATMQHLTFYSTDLPSAIALGKKYVTTMKETYPQIGMSFQNVTPLVVNLNRMIEAQLITDDSK